MIKNYNQNSQKVCHLVKKEDKNKNIINHRRQRSVMIISSLFIAFILGIFILVPKIKNELSKKYTIKENKMEQTRQNNQHINNYNPQR